jgi:hypothetical protein
VALSWLAAARTAHTLARGSPSMALRSESGTHEWAPARMPPQARPSRDALLQVREQGGLCLASGPVRAPVFLLTSTGQRTPPGPDTSADTPASGARFVFFALFGTKGCNSRLAQEQGTFLGTSGTGRNPSPDPADDTATTYEVAFSFLSTSARLREPQTPTHQWLGLEPAGAGIGAPGELGPRHPFKRFRAHFRHNRTPSV